MLLSPSLLLALAAWLALAVAAPIIPREPAPWPDPAKLRKPTPEEVEKILPETRLAHLTRAKMSNWTLPGASICELAEWFGGQLGNCGCPYQYGGTDCSCCNSPSPSGPGTDCSGLVWCAFNAAGWNGVGRDTKEQIVQTTIPPGCTPDNTGACGPADVFFYCFEQPCPSHVVMVLSGGLCAECPHTGAYCHIIQCYSEGFQQAGRFPVCQQCQPNCAGKNCGDDGCGGSCGTCTAPDVCDGSGQCVCQPDCSGKNCGDDGCGGSCGTCGLPSDLCFGTRCENAQRQLAVLTTEAESVLVASSIYYLLGGTMRPNGSDWTPMSPFLPNVQGTELKAIIDSAGRMQFFWSYNALAHFAYQNADGSWTGPINLPLFADEISVTKDVDGNILIFGLVKGYGQIFVLQQTSPGNNWAPIVYITGDAWDFVAQPLSDGSIDLISVGYLSALMHVHQSSTSSLQNWDAPVFFSGCDGYAITSIQNADQRAEFFYIDTTHDHLLWHAYQLSNTSTDWSGCSSMGVATQTVAVGRNADGRLELFVSNGGVPAHLWQLTPGGSWSAVAEFSSLPGGLLQPSGFTVLTHLDGTLELFAVAANHSIVSTIQQTAGDSSSWSGWSSLPHSWAA